MLKCKNLKMGTRSKAQFTLTIRKVSVYIASKGKRFYGHFVYFFVLVVWNIINLAEIGMWGDQSKKTVLSVKFSLYWTIMQNFPDKILHQPFATDSKPL